MLSNLERTLMTKVAQMQEALEDAQRMGDTLTEAYDAQIERARLAQNTARTLSDSLRVAHNDIAYWRRLYYSTLGQLQCLQKRYEEQRAKLCERNTRITHLTQQAENATKWLSYYQKERDNARQALCDLEAERDQLAARLQQLSDHRAG